MAEEEILGHTDVTVEQAIKLIKRGEFKDIFNRIFDSLKSIIEKNKELKQLASKHLREDDEDKSSPFSETYFDFTETIDILSNKSLKNTRLTEKDKETIKNFIDKYLNNDNFLEEVEKYGKKYVSDIKENSNIDILHLEAIMTFFDDFPNMILELKIYMQRVLSFLDLDFTIDFTDEDKTQILEIIHSKINRENLSIKNKQLIKEYLEEEIEELEFSNFISKDKIKKYFDNWFDNVYKKRFVDIDKLKKLVNTRKPRPNFKYEITHYHGMFSWLVNFIKEMFGMPLSKLFLIAYNGTKLKDGFKEENKNGFYEEIITLEMFNIGNDLNRLFTKTEHVLTLLEINENVLNEHSIDKMTIFQHFVKADYEICEFMYQFYKDIKKIGILMGKVKANYFCAFLYKVLNNFKSTINTPVNNYYNTHEKDFEEDKKLEISKSLKQIGNELSGLYVNTSRIEDMDKKNS